MIVAMYKCINNYIKEQDTKIKLKCFFFNIRVHPFIGL